jgi:hypothetical protein
VYVLTLSAVKMEFFSVVPSQLLEQLKRAYILKENNFRKHTDVSFFLSLSSSSLYLYFFF